jgi:hypothetical protein
LGKECHPLPIKKKTSKYFQTKKWERKKKKQVTKDTSERKATLNNKVGRNYVNTSFLIRIEIDIIHGVTCSNEHWNDNTNPKFVRAVSETQKMSFSYVQKCTSQIHRPPTNFNHKG